MNRKLFTGRILMLIVGLVLIIGAATTAAAQGEPYLELMRKDLQTEKVAVMTEAMQLSEEEGDRVLADLPGVPDQVEWDRRPAYRDDQGLRRDTSRTSTAEKAGEMTSAWFKIQEDRLSLLKKTAKKIGKDIDPTVAMRFVQVENAINLAIDLQVASEIPLLQ